MTRNEKDKHLIIDPKKFSRADNCMWYNTWYNITAGTQRNAEDLYTCLNLMDFYILSTCCLH